MAKTESWVKEFRKTIKTKIGSGWQVSNDRGNMRLLHGNKKEGFTSINLPFAWQKDQWTEAYKFIEFGAEAYKESNKKLPLKTAFKLTKQSSTELKLDWESALVNYRRANKYAIGEATWEKKHLPVLEGVMEYMNRTKHKPENAKTLYKKVLNEYKHGQYKHLVGWKFGTQMRRHMRISLTKFLNYCVREEDFPSYWIPPELSIEERLSNNHVKTNKRIGYPLTDFQIQRLVEAFPEDNEQAQKWKFAVQICAVFGLRPEELRHLVVRNKHSKEPELWCTYQKQNSNTRERQLFPLWIKDLDGTVMDWSKGLIGRLTAGEKLPEIPKGKGGQNIGQYLRRRSVSDCWEVLCSEAQSEGLECTPYSFRHRYAYVSHTRPQDNGTMRSITQIAEAMGHDPETNFKSYARFKNKNLAKVFDRVEV